MTLADGLINDAVTTPGNGFIPSGGGRKRFDSLRNFCRKYLSPESRIVKAAAGDIVAADFREGCRRGRGVCPALVISAEADRACVIPLIPSGPPGALWARDPSRITIGQPAGMEGSCDLHISEMCFLRAPFLGKQVSRIEADSGLFRSICETVANDVLGRDRRTSGNLKTARTGDICRIDFTGAAADAPKDVKFGLVVAGFDDRILYLPAIEKWEDVRSQESENQEGENQISFLVSFQGLDSVPMQKVLGQFARIDPESDSFRELHRNLREAVIGSDPAAPVTSHA